MMNWKLAGDVPRRVEFGFALMLWAVFVLAAPERVAAQDAKADAETIAEFTSDDTFDGYITKSNERYNIYVFGDSFAEGLTAGLGRALAGNKKVKLRPRSRAGTGLARPDRYDWNRALAKILEGKRIDIAVVFIGSNDTSSVTTKQGRFKLGTPEWRKSYIAYVDQFIKQLAEHGSAVYWVGLPPMWRPSYDQSSTIVSAIHRERVLAAGMKFINIRAQFADKNDKFNLKGFDKDGQFQVLRSRDGVHFLRRGNDKLASLIFGVIEKDLQKAETGGMSAFDDEEGGTVTEVQSTALNLPVFSQESETGAALPVNLGPKITLVRRQRPVEETKAQAQLRPSIVIRGTGRNNGFAPKVAPNSRAAKVLVNGESLKPKPGRADDFSWPAQ